MTFLLVTHSILRWIILLVAVTAIIKFAIGWGRGGAFKGMDRGLTAAFSGLMDLQATLGIIFLLWNGLATGIGFPNYRIVHGVIMILAASAAHISARWKNVDDTTRFRNNLFVVIGAVVLVLAGTAVLPGGFSR